MITSQQYDTVLESCRDIFLRKTDDYGTSWRVYQATSIIDQIYIKAKTISVSSNKSKQATAGIISRNFQSIVNYCIIGLIQFDLKIVAVETLANSDAENLYNEKALAAKKVVISGKTGSADFSLREKLYPESLAGAILLKRKEIKAVLKRGRQESQEIRENYYSMIGYAVLGLSL